MLVQEVVDVPRLVADHEVVLALLDDLAEHHEVVHEDLVHVAQRLERVQVVLPARTPRSAPTRSPARRSRGAPARRSRRGTRSTGGLGQPVDLDVGTARAQRAGDAEVTPRVPEPDRRGDEERPRRARRGRAQPQRPVRRAAAGATSSRNSRSSRLTSDRVPRLRQVADALQRDHPTAGELGDGARCAPAAGTRPARRRSPAPGCVPARASARPPRRRATPRLASRAAIWLSTSLSAAHPTASSHCLVECASGSSWSKKNSVNPR